MDKGEIKFILKGRDVRILIGLATAQAACSIYASFNGSPGVAVLVALSVVFTSAVLGRVAGERSVEYSLWGSGEEKQRGSEEG